MPTRLAHQPGEVLGRYVEVIAFHEGFVFPHERELFLPDGGVDLVIDLGNTPKRLFLDETGGGHQHFHKGWLSGMRTNRSIIESGDGSPMVVLRFKSGGAHHFFDPDMHELKDRVVPLHDLWGPAFHALRDRIGEHWTTRGAEGLLEVVEDSMQEFLRPEEQLPRIAHAISKITGSEGQTRVAHIARSLGWSEKHLNTMFKRELGLSPKAYIRIIRFQTVVQRLERDTTPDWMQVAVDHGYYDHSHLVNDFKTTAGMSPERYLTMKGPFVNWIPLATRV